MLLVQTCESLAIGLKDIYTEGAERRNMLELMKQFATINANRISKRIIGILNGDLDDLYNVLSNDEYLQLKQKDIATLLGMSPSSLSKHISKKYKNGRKSDTVLFFNPKSFIGDKDLVIGFGPNKDFYIGMDNEFIAHKGRLLKCLEAIDVASRNNAYSRITYAKVKMRSDAIAKSHRPTKSIFTPNKRNFVVGGAGVGELLIEMHPGLY